MNTTLRAAAAFGLSLTSAAACAQAADLLAPVAWLAGCWAADGREPGSGEQWSAPAGGTMLGVGRTVKNGRTVEHEFMQLRANAEGKLTLIAQPSGQRETSFLLAAAAADGAVTFENPQHDFPQRVIYRPLPDGRMLARIEGPRHGIDVPMRRVPCP